MKELQAHLNKGDRIEINAKKNNQQETTLVLNVVIGKKSGHTLFEINTTSLVVKEAEFNKNKDISFHAAKRKDYSGINSLLINEGCVYIPALNKHNALKQFRKNPNQDAYYKKEALFNLRENFF